MSTVEKAYERGFRASSDAITITRLDDGEILEANDSFCEMVGFDRDEVIGRTALELGIYPDPTSRTRFVRRVLHRGGVSDHDVEVRTRKGERRYASLSATLISEHGEVQLFTIGRDVTLRHQRHSDLVERVHHAEAACCSKHGAVARVHQLLDLTSDADGEPAPAG